VETLSELIAQVRRLALVGLAKNTGKTQTLTTILAEHARRGVRVAVTSIGRDGEGHDVIDERIDKPRIRLWPDSLVASTDALLRTSGLEHERLTRTGVRTPLGEVVVARVLAEGEVEVAGPSSAEELRDVSSAMLAMGAQQVLIDGSVDRRAAASPHVAGGLVLATGAVLSQDIDQVLARTVEAVEVIRLPSADPTDRMGAPVTLSRGLVLNAQQQQIDTLLSEHPSAHTFLADGALGESFLQGLIAARRARAGRELRIVAGDPTKVFLSRHGPSWYERQGLRIEVLHPIALKAITVNPLAPGSHEFDSARLRELIETAIPSVPVLDVLDPDYA
jgi:hypothetical protein